LRGTDSNFRDFFEILRGVSHAQAGVTHVTAAVPVPKTPSPKIFGDGLSPQISSEIFFVQRDCSCWIFRVQTLQLLNIQEQSQAPTQA